MVISALAATRNDLSHSCASLPVELGYSRAGSLSLRTDWTQPGLSKESEEHLGSERKLEGLDE
jgi:hypothetical protein